MIAHVCLGEDLRTTQQLQLQQQQQQTTPRPGLEDLWLLDQISSRCIRAGKQANKKARSGLVGVVGRHYRTDRASRGSRC